MSATRLPHVSPFYLTNKSPKIPCEFILSLDLPRPPSRAGQRVDVCHHSKIDKSRNYRDITAHTFLKYSSMCYYYCRVFMAKPCAYLTSNYLCFWGAGHWGSFLTQCPVSMERGENREVWCPG